MIDCINLELRIRKDYLGDSVIETIYFGGGTPSLLSGLELRSILDNIKSNFSISKNVEVTLEANPDDITNELAKTWKEEGINRLSIGLQSFKQSDLDWMNRAHDAGESIQSVLIAQEAGFDNITVDLIYGLPELTLSEWEDHIQKVIDLDVQHVSAYCLTVEPKTALNKWVENKKITPANEDQQSEQFLLLVKRLKAANFEQYEISNFGKNGAESIHNSNYWKGESYLGAGPSAHSFNGTERAWNISNNQRYMDAVENQLEYSEKETLSPENRFNELILTGLRTKYGVNMNQLNGIKAVSNAFLNTLESFIKSGWVTKTESSIFLTEEGRLKADFIASELFID